MANATTGMPTAADLILTMDAMAKWFKQTVTPFGQGLDSESSTPTFAWLIRNALNKDVGDGSTVYGMQNAALQALVEPTLEERFSANRYESNAKQMRTLLANLSDFVTNEGRVPKSLVNVGNSKVYQAWKLSTSSIATGSGNQALDGWLQYINGTWVSGSLYATAPTNALSLAATTGGQLTPIASGSAPRLAYAWVYDTDFHTSLLSPWSAQVALSSIQSAYNATNWDSVPTGATKVRIFRESYANAGTGTASYVKDIPVSFGTAVGTQLMSEGDLVLRSDILPPSWMSCPVMPEFALLMALCFASQPVIRTALFQLSASGMFSPYVVGLGPLTGLLGYTNPVGGATFGKNSNNTVWTAGTLQTTSDYSQGLQGFSGAWNDVQFRVTSTLNASASLSNIGYHYRSAAAPNGTTGTIAGPLTLTAVVGDTVAMGVPAGRIVTSIDSMTIGGMATGNFLAEAKVIRVL